MSDYKEYILNKFAECNHVQLIMEGKDVDLIEVDFLYYGSYITARFYNEHTAQLVMFRMGDMPQQTLEEEIGVIETEDLYNLLMSIPDINKLLINTKDKIIH